jgi:hypothetical protein
MRRIAATPVPVVGSFGHLAPTHQTRRLSLQVALLFERDTDHAVGLEGEQHTTRGDLLKAASEESRIAFYFQSKGASQGVWETCDRAALRRKGKFSGGARHWREDVGFIVGSWRPLRGIDERKGRQGGPILQSPHVSNGRFPAELRPTVPSAKRRATTRDF